MVAVSEIKYSCWQPCSASTWRVIAPFIAGRANEKLITVRILQFSVDQDASIGGDAAGAENPASGGGRNRPAERQAGEQAEKRQAVRKLFPAQKAPERAPEPPAPQREPREPPAPKRERTYEELARALPQNSFRPWCVRVGGVAKRA
jgi:hypothetical protein